MPVDKPAIKVAREFVIAYLGRGCFAPFTGQDYSGWMAFVHLVEMYGRGDSLGRTSAIDAMRCVIAGVQEKECIHQVFCQTIPAILDWCHVAEIWPQLETTHRFIGTPWSLVAVTEVTDAQRKREARSDQKRCTP